MEFIPLLENHYDRTILMSIMIIATVLLVATAIFMTVNSKKNPTLVNRWAFLSPVLLLSVVACSLMVHHHDRIQSDNRAIAKTNLAMKYEVKQVFTHRHQTELFTTKPSPVVVQSDEGEMITLNYAIDPKTSEPFLTDRPKDIHPFRETPVADITRK